MLEVHGGRAGDARGRGGAVQRARAAGEGPLHADLAVEVARGLALLARGDDAHLGARVDQRVGELRGVRGHAGAPAVALAGRRVGAHEGDVRPRHARPPQSGW